MCAAFPKVEESTIKTINGMATTSSGLDETGFPG